MITIYSIEGIEYLPLEIIGRVREDCRERQFAVNLMQWYILGLLVLLKGPVKVLSFVLPFWPGILYG